MIQVSPVLLVQKSKSNSNKKNKKKKKKHHSTSTKQPQLHSVRAAAPAQQRYLFLVVPRLSCCSCLRRRTSSGLDMILELMFVISELICLSWSEVAWSCCPFWFLVVP